MSVLRAFLAHPKSLENDSELEVLKQQAATAIGGLIRLHGGGRTPEVIAGRDDFNARVLTTGGWDAWADSVSAFETLREDGRFGTFFDLIVVAPDDRVGRGTARIVDTALRRHFPVYFLRDGSLHPVGGLVTVDSRDFRAGYALHWTDPCPPSG